MNSKLSNVLMFFVTVFIFTGCSVKEIDLENILTPEKKEFVYERKAVDENLLLKVKSITSAMANNQLNLINKKFIHPEFGFYNLYKLDGHKVFVPQKKIYNIIEDKTDEISHLISRVSKKAVVLPIKQENVNFRCSPKNDAYYGWNDEGIYLNDKTRTYLSSLMDYINSYSKDIKYQEEDLHKAKLIEKTGYKVVLTPEIIYYLNYIDDDWYITMFDRITTDCSTPKKGKKK